MLACKGQKGREICKTSSFYNFGDKMNFVPVLEKFSENYILWILQYYTLSKTFYTSTTWGPELLWFRYRTEKTTAWNVSKYGVFSSPYFSAFRLKTERYGVSLHIQSECEKIRIRKNSEFRHFLRSELSL